MRSSTLLAVGSALILAVSAAAQEEVSPAEAIAVAKAAAPSLVRVEYTLQYDRGEAAQTAGWSYRCPNCGRFHSTVQPEELIKEERPLELGGFLLDPTTVMTRDPLLHPRFVKSIRVRFGEQSVEAEVKGYVTDQVALLLALARPLEGGKPLDFVAGRSEPFLAVTYVREEGEWRTTVQALPSTVTWASSGRQFRATPSYCLIVDKTRAAVGLSMKDELPPDDSWKGSPLGWPKVSAAEMAERLAACEKTVGQGILRVELTFRSPKQKAGGGFWRLESDGDGLASTKRDVAGVLLDPKRILVIADLRPKGTGLLDRIAVWPSEGKSVEAKFACSLRDYGCFIAELEEPLPGPIELSGQEILGLRNKLLLAADVRIQGEKRVAYYAHERIASFKTRWNQQVFPDLAEGVERQFLFDPSGKLAALPVARREKVTEQERWGSSKQGLLVPAVYLKEVLADLQRHVDASNVPLTEAEENRLAWMGVDLQALDKDLARVNNVSDLTKDGETGALVSFVYPDSPAAKAGVEQGDILLRLHVEGEPKPLEIGIEDDGLGFESFPWDQIDQLPEELSDQVPTPWPSAENSFTRSLTNLGFGKKYAAEVFHDGKVVSKEFEIVQSPPHYEAAPRYKSEGLGLTVRNMTYEVRRYFQKTADDPGVVVSKIEQGSKASVAGLKPFEIITHVNDAPVTHVEDFEKLSAEPGELRLAVKRLTQGRIVKIKSPASTTQESKAIDR